MWNEELVDELLEHRKLLRISLRVLLDILETGGTPIKDSCRIANEVLKRTETIKYWEKK